MQQTNKNNINDENFEPIMNRKLRLSLSVHCCNREPNDPGFLRGLSFGLP